MTISIDAEMTLVEVLVILLGIAVTWAVYYGSGRAELPGEATVPDPREPEEPNPMVEGRTLR